MTNEVNDKTAISAQTWGLAPGARVWIGGHDAATKRFVHAHLSDTVRPPTGPIDVAFIAAVSVGEAIHFAGKLHPRLRPTGVVWIICSDAASPVGSARNRDLEELIVRLDELGFVMDRVECDAGYTLLAFRLPTEPRQ